MRQYRPWLDSELEFLRENHALYGNIGCGKYLGRPTIAVRKKASELGLHIPKRRLPERKGSPAHYATRYKSDQLEALDAIGMAYSRDKTIDFDTATELRDLVRANRIHEALEFLNPKRRRAA